MSFAGRHHSEESKTRMRLSHLGEKHSAERKHKESLSHMGIKASEETKAKMREAHLGEKNHMYGKKMSGESRGKMRAARVGMTLSEEHKAQIAESLIGNTRSAGSSNHNKPHSVEAKAKISKANSAIMLEMWSDHEFKDKRVKAIIQGNKITPNIPETKLMELLERLYPGEWEYSGDGVVIIGGRNPDFFNVNGQKAVVEMFGDWWHRGEDPEERIAHYRRFGFRCLVIWERELEDEGALVSRVEQFVGG